MSNLQIIKNKKVLFETIYIIIFIERAQVWQKTEKEKKNLFQEVKENEEIFYEVKWWQ